MISVITCTHNPKPAYLAQVLKALKAQTLPLTEWEFLLVDNASREALSTSADLKWHPLARHIREDELGLTSARLRGVREAKGELLVFVDDDNVLSPDYLMVANRYRVEKGWMGAFSGQCEAVFEEPPPAWTEPYRANLAIREVKQDRWSNLPNISETMPNGAGLCVRRDVAQFYLRLHETGKRPVKCDRVGKSLLSGGDNDLAACAADIGLGMGLFAALRLKHLISPDRLTEDYLLRLTEGIAYSGVMVHSFRGICRPLPSLGRRALDFVKLMFMPARRRRFFLANKRGERRGHRDLAKAGIGKT